ncbi:MAG: FixG Ig-like domain-containing protein, partial [Asticcacaulis sp.]
FVQLKDGSFRNAYTVKIANKGLDAATYRLSLDGPRLKEITLAGQALAAGEAIEIPVEANKVRSVRLFVIAEGADLSAGSVPVRFTVTETRTGVHDSVRSVFLSGRANEKRD